VNRVLVVDDDPEIRLLYEEELSEDGYDIISSNGERGLLQLIAVKSPDVILLDVNLRSQSALDLLQRIRSAFRWIPVIVTTFVLRPTLIRNCSGPTLMSRRAHI
jgi:CheY-like chemotaxis protein